MAFRILSIFSALIIVFVLILGVDIEILGLAVPLILLQNVYMIIASRKNILLLFVTLLITYSNYSVLFANFINPIDSGYVEEITHSVSVISLNILLLFNCILMLAVRWDKVSNTSGIIFSSNRKIPALFGAFLTLTLVFVFFFGFKMPDEIGGRGEPKAIYEYALVFFILLFYYFNKNVFYVKAGLVLVLFYSLQNFIFGGRIMGIQFISCIYFILYMNKIPQIVVMLLLCFGFIFMTFIGAVRGELLSSSFSLMGIMGKVVENGFALDTAYSAYYCAESFVYCHDIIPLSERLFLFAEFVKGVFLSTDPKYVLHSITASYVHHTGGGFIPHFFYFYLGPLGVFVGGLIVSFFLNIIRKVNNATTEVKKLIALFVTCITFRWYLYSPLDLLRGVLFLIISYYLFLYVNNALRKRKN